MIAEALELAGVLAVIAAAASLAWLLAGPFALPAGLAVAGVGLYLLSVVIERNSTKGGDEL